MASSRGDRILLILDKVAAGCRWFSMERGLRTCAYFTPHVSLSNNITDSGAADLNFVLVIVRHIEHDLTLRQK